MFSKIKVPKKLITTVIVVLAIILVAFIVIKVVMGSENYVRFSNAGLNISDAKKSIGVIKNDAGLTEVANNGTLKLEYNPSDDLFVLTDLKTGKTIRSYPELTEEENLKYEKNPLGKKILTSPFKVNFSKSGNDRSADFFVNQTIHKKTVNKIENGVQLVYNLTETKVSLAIEFTIDGNAFEVKIPRNSIVEKSDISRIASVALLPYFDAARQEDYGYFVTPDGSGALTYFNATRVTNYDSYAKRIYGDDMTFARLISPDYKSKSITMSVYGIVKENHYVTTYIHDGDTNAALLISYPGDRTLPFYSTSFEYHFRQFYLTKLSKSGKDFELLEENITLGDVRQRYYIEAKNEEKQYSYVDVANKTRELLLETWKNKYGYTKVQNESAKSVNLRIFMGDKNRWGGAVDALKVMTSFDEVIEIYESLAEKGVENIRLSILGWQKNGYYGNITNKFNPDSEFGGKKGFIRLTSWADQNDVEVSFDNNILLVYGKPKASISLRTSVVKKPGVNYLQFQTTTNSGVFRMGMENYVLSPKYYEKKVMSKEINKLKDIGTKNVDLQQVGDVLFSDYNKANALLRSQVADKYVNWLKTYKNNFDNVSIYYGNSFAVAYADNILNIPNTSSTNMILDETVPFIQIVYHGLVDYYCNPLNSEDDIKYAMLKSLEYGSFFSFELTYKPTGDLKYTSYNTLFKSEYNLLADDVVEAYNVAEKHLQPLRNERITNHYRIDENAEVFCTEYSDGTKIYVNYEHAAYNITGAGITVDAMSFEVTKG